MKKSLVALSILVGVFLLTRATLAVDITWSQVNTDGFGDVNNYEAYGSVVFNDQLYIGTSNDVTGGEVWRYNGTNWTQVNTDGFGDANSWYVYELFEFNNQLYAGVGNETTGVEVWRYNGTAWSQINTDGFGDANNNIGFSASMVEYNNNLYLGVSNWTTGGEVWRYNGTNWTQVNTDGFGDANNSDLFDMIILDNNLYAGTLNTTTGGEVWRYNGTNWTQVNTDGFGDANNIGVLEMVVYNNTLYTGGWNVTTGSELWAYSGSAWSQINTDGYGDANNTSSLSLEIYYDLLHIGTTNSTTGGEVWQFNGTNVTQVNNDGYNEVNNRSTGSQTVYDYKLYAGVRNQVTGVEIWQGEIPDLTDPTIASQSPANSATGVAKNTNISFVLDDDVWGVNSDSIDVTIEGEDVVVDGVFQTNYAGTIVSDGDKGYAVTINPDSNFSLGLEVNVVASFADFLGNSTSSSWAFTVNAAPSVSGQNPADGAEDIDRNTNIFCEITDAEGTVDQGTIDLLVEEVNAIEAGSSASGFTSTISDDGEGGFDITIDPDDNFSAAQEVNMELNVCDNLGDCSSTTWSFTTVAIPPSLGIVMTPASAGGPNIRVVDENGTQISSFFAYDESLRMGLEVEQADIDGDNVNEIIITPGVGVESTIKAFEVDGTEIASTLAFNEGFTGGVSLACGDFDGDGKDDITVTPTSAGGPNVRTYSLNAAGNAFTLKDWFFAYDENFRGGINLSAGDITGDGLVDELVVAPRGSGGPNVRVYQYNTNKAAFEVLDWVMAYQEEYHGGVQLATGDIDGDGGADVVVSPYLGGGPNIRIYTLNTSNELELLDWFLAYEEAYRGTLSMAVGDTDGDGTGEVVTVPLTYGGPDVRVFKYANDDFESVAGYYAYDANFHGGVNLFVNDVDEDGMAEVMTSPASAGGPNVRVYDLDTGRESLKGWFWAFPEGFRGGVNFGK